MTPERLVVASVERLREWFSVAIEEITLRIEQQHFPLPPELRDSGNEPGPSPATPLVSTSDWLAGK